MKLRYPENDFKFAQESINPFEADILYFKDKFKNEDNPLAKLKFKKQVDMLREMERIRLISQ